jgi:lipopolysaccharide transport system ATP-binding protein
MKMKNYSSGMYVRLAFSVAIQADAPILIVDEVLAVGDANFQQKCFDVFERYKKEGKTIVFVSHDTGSMRRFCDKIILLEEGMLAKQGKPNEIIDFYIRGNSKESSDTKLISISKVKDNKKIEEEIEKEIILKIRKDPLNTIYKEKYNIIKYAEEIDKNEDFSIITLNTLNSNNKKTEEFNSKEDIILEFIIKASKNNNDLQIGIQIFSETGIELLGFTNTMLKDKLMLKKGLNKVKFRMGNLNVLSCKLLITYALFSDLENKIKYYHYSWNKNHIKIKSSSEFEGILDPRISIKK